jgi:hypothetical protein
VKVILIVQRFSVVFRVLLASIRDGSEWLCPVCLCRKGQVFRLGMASDMKIRNKKYREASEHLRQRIQIARKIIYKDGYVVNSTVLDPFLKEGSYVTTDVSV